MSRFLSIHEAYNARTKSIREICESFIVSHEFHELAGANNTILSGPRGSGKTTLMKMLQVQALDTWQGNDAEEFKTSIRYNGVFVRTDRIWKKQFDRLNSKLDDGQIKVYKPFLESLFTYHVLEQLIVTLSYIVERDRLVDSQCSISKKDEVELVRELSVGWCVHPKMMSFRSLAIAITFKKNEVSNFINDVLVVGEKLESTPSIVKGDLSDVLGASILAINLYLGKPDRKWCFLFDELELAPSDIIQPLINSMRGGSDLIILKLSLSPYHEGVSIGLNSYSTMERQDVSKINLVEFDKKRQEAKRKFCYELSRSIFLRNGLGDDPDSYFLKPEKMNVKDVFRSYREKSTSFREYLEKESIDVEKIDDYKEDDLLPTIRKIQFVVFLNDVSKNEAGKGSSVRRPSDYYSGFYNIFEQVEFNPRMMVGLLSSFVNEIKASGFVSIPKQISLLEAMCESYVSMLETIPIGMMSRELNLFDLIDRVGGFFKVSTYSSKFNPQPYSCFVMDVIAPDIVSAIGHAWNAGAIIDEEGSIDGIENRRFRLSYIFSHRYGLPKVLGRDVKLSAILNGNKYKGERQLGLDI